MANPSLVKMIFRDEETELLRRGYAVLVLFLLIIECPNEWFATRNENWSATACNVLLALVNVTHWTSHSGAYS